MKLARMRYFTLLASITLLSYVLGPAQTGAGFRRDDPGDQPLPPHVARFAMTGTGEIQLILELEEPSVIEALRLPAARPEPPGMDGLAAAPRLILQSAQASEASSRVAVMQRQVIERAGRLDGLRVEAAVELVLDAVIVRTPARHYWTLSRLPGVKKVHVSGEYELHMDTAAALVNSQAVWQRVGGSDKAGAGVKIGIIDSGIDMDNPMFQDTNFVMPSGYPKGDNDFTNKKVIVARSYVDLMRNPQAVKTPLDEMGHGSFVAGCAAGNRVQAPLATISGVAPAAYLGNYKVFGTPGINERTTDAAVIAAIEAATADGMDVINMSIGERDYLPWNDDPSARAVASAIAAGISVVISAGNDGSGIHTIGNPGTAPAAITVGAASNSRYFAAMLHVTAPSPVPADLQNIAYTPGDGPAIASKIPATAIVDLSTLDTTGLGCGALPAGSLAGKLAFISRGDCTFVTKVTNAANAGATAVIVYNNVAGASPMAMGGLTSSTIPAVMISNAAGLALKAFIAANPNSCRVGIDEANLLTAQPAAGGVLESFSSRGPGSDFNIKPDLVAPGANIYSAAQNNDPKGSVYSASQFKSGQGTSFSGPIVAGAAAVMKQLYPNLSPAGIKSVLATTASPTVTLPGGGIPNVVETGAGMLDLSRAMNAGAVFQPTNLSFGVRSYSDRATLASSFTITNITNSSDRYTVTHEPIVAGPTVALGTSEATSSVAPGGSITVQVTLSAQAPLTGAYQGIFRVQSQQSGMTYRIPYWAGLYVPDTSRILTVQKTGGAYSSLGNALAAARPGNVIEIRDSETYSGDVMINTNAEGLPLHGLTIRAAAGAKPVIEAASTATNNIWLVGLRNVLLQGLTIKGGRTGLFLYEPSSALPLSATLDQCTFTDFGESGSYSAAISIQRGMSISITRSTISGTGGFGIDAYQGAQVTVSDSTIQNTSGGISGSASNIQVLGCTITGGSGPRLFLYDCSGTIEGSTLASATGSFGDGAQIIGGNFSVSGNIIENNQRFGLAVYSDTGLLARGIFARNLMRGNASAGAFFSNTPGMRLEGNTILANGRGVRCTGTTTGVVVNNTVARSTSTDSGDGIQVAGTANIRVVHNTVYKNKRRGMSKGADTRIKVANCIVSANDAGDFESVLPEDVSYTLVGDATLTGNNNITGDPRFVNPDGDDFNLGAGSPAIDKGNNAAPDLPFLDGASFLRVASAVMRPGEGRVDMGALEAGSVYPLVFPLLANGSQLTLADDFTTGFAVLNKTATEIAAAFTAYNDNGSLLLGNSNPSVRSFAGGAQVPILGFQLFGFGDATSQTGSVLGGSLRRLVGFFLLFDRSFQRLADGVDVSGEASQDIYLMRHLNDASGRTSYVIFNPGVNSANITATLFNADGGVVGAPRNFAIAAKGQLMLKFESITTASGYVRIQSDFPIAALETFGGRTEYSALRGMGPGMEGRLYFTHFAANQGFDTLIGVGNTSDSAINLTLRAFLSDGAQVGSEVRRTLPAGAQLLDNVRTLFGLGSSPMFTGYILATGNHGGLVGFTAFRYDDGSVQSAAAVPAMSVPRKRLVFSHVAHQVAAGSGGTYQTGIALLNPFGLRIPYTMRVFNGNGAKVAEMTGFLEAGEKVAKILSHPVAGAGFFTQALPLGSGHVEVTTDYGLLGFELFFTETFSQLASVPAQIP